MINPSELPKLQKRLGDLVIKDLISWGYTNTKESPEQQIFPIQGCYKIT